MKKCRACKELKNESDFYRDNSMVSGVSNLCKTCSADRGKRYRQTDKARFNLLKELGRRKNLDVTVDFSWFCEQLEKQCHYCGSKLNRNSYSYFLDRKDIKDGYSKENLVPCCTDCNYLKGGFFEKNFIDHCRKVAAYNEEKKENKNS